MNISEMSFNELVAGHKALMVSINELIEKSREYEQAILNKKEEVMREFARAYVAVKELGVTEEELKAFLDKESATAEVPSQESLALPEPVLEENVTRVEDSINSENIEEEESKTAMTSIWDHPALTAPYNPVTAKKREAPAALPAPVEEKDGSIIPEPQEETKVEKAIELAKTLPLAKGIDDREPYFVTYEFAVSKKGELTLDAETFGRNETAEIISRIKVERMSNAKLLHATDVVSTGDCTAYMWYEGKYITVTFYSVPIKETTGTESDENLPSMDSLLSDDPEYKEFYHPVTAVEESNRSLPTLGELLSGEPVKQILCMGNLDPKGTGFRQNTRICHVDGIIPTETASGKTLIYIPPAPSAAA